MHGNSRLISVLADGFLTGLILQLAIGPVFFFVLNVTLQRSAVDGLYAVAAVTVVDYLYIALAILGVGRLIERPRIKKPLGIVGSVVLVILGTLMLMSIIRATGKPGFVSAEASPNHLSSFLSAFILTISSPLTIVFWTGLFATKTIEKDYNRQQVVLFGIPAGFATFVFLGVTVWIFSTLGAVVPDLIIKLLNAIVGVLLVLYGVLRLMKVLTKGRTPG
jgi:threonine/homoserine/homoserine lactone efflux protein